MPRKKPMMAMAIDPDDDGPSENLEASMAFTAGGSLKCHEFRMNGIGMVSGIPFEEIVLGKELGRGASSTVYKGEARGNLVAVKQLSNVNDKELRKQLCAEMQFLKDHLKDDPCVHLVTIYDAYYVDEMTYIVLEFCPGGALDDCIAAHGAASEPCLAVIMRQIMFGLTHLYNKKIVHRDMKPANCLVTEDGVVKISDFGSSKQGEQLEGGMAETFTGTTRYMSPERLQGDKYSWPADVWCAGMIMLELAFADHPYKIAFGEDGSFMAMIENSKKETPQLPDEYSDEARDFANLCLAKDPSQRPPPPEVVNQNSPTDSHPWVVKWMECSNEVVVEWLAVTK